METYTLVILTLAATLRVATPLLLAAIGAMFSERSGVIDLALEGKMLGAAFASAAVSAISGSAWLGLLAGIGASVLLALVNAFATVTHRGNQVVASMAINIAVSGLGPTLGLAWFNIGGQTPQLDAPGQRFAEIVWPGAAAARHVPIVGLIYAEILSGHNLIVYGAAALVPVAAWVLYRSRFGLRLRAVGENPLAVDTAGISVNGLRYQAMIISGVLCGVAGTYLSTAASASFVRDMTAGKGYLALAAVIFGKWKPYPTLGACLLFAFTDALASRLQGVALPVVGVIPVQFILALPYVLTVLLLAGFVGRAVAPRAIGVPYSKDK
ncbi:MAG TPA: ABC transporter permease [Candidatus Didemnitutus sp.]|nr:ABC transporter permease [Candidatus Didemnitutus sp.]